MKVYYIDWDELQEYVDKFGELIKHIVPYQISCSDVNGGRKFVLIIDESSKSSNNDLDLPSGASFGQTAPINPFAK